MNYRLLNRLIGYDRYTVSGAVGESVADLLLCYNVPFWDLRGEGESVVFCAPLSLRRRLCTLWKERGFCYRVELCGLPKRLWLYRKRWGMVLGLVLFIFFLQFASGHVWEIRVVDREGEEGLKELFGQAGLREGMAAADFDNALFSAAFLAQNPQYSYVSAGIHGGVARVWLHDRSRAPSVEENTGVANLVAAEEGEILWCEAAYGQVMVNYGDKVQKGQLLVSGVVEGRNGGYRLERASGRVLAKVKKEVTVEIPLSFEQKVYTGEEKTLTGLRILGKNINFFGFYGKNLQFCDTIDSVEEFTTILGIRLPFYLVKRSYAPYQVRQVSYSTEQATRLAYDEYHRRVNEDLGALELLEESVQVDCKEDKVILHASFTAVMDISQTQEIRVGDLVLFPLEKG